MAPLNCAKYVCFGPLWSIHSFSWSLNPFLLRRPLLWLLCNQTTRGAPIRHRVTEAEVEKFIVKLIMDDNVLIHFTHPPTKERKYISFPTIVYGWAYSYPTTLTAKGTKWQYKMFRTKNRVLQQRKNKELSHSSTVHKHQNSSTHLWKSSC